MNTFEGNVVCLRPADSGSMRHLALMLGNGTRQSEAQFADIGRASACLSMLAQEQAELSNAAAVLSGDLRAVMAQIEYCQTLWAEFKNI